MKSILMTNVMRTFATLTLFKAPQISWKINEKKNIS